MVICFNAIVKNEEQVILRCLKSFLPLIDTWCIVDTGSTDKTMSLIADFFKEHNIPGELYQRDWVDFEHNRNEALQLARDKLGSDDYCLCADADEEIVIPSNFKLPSPMTATIYHCEIQHGCRFQRTRFYQAHKYSWAYPAHEILLPEKGVIETRVVLKDIWVKSYTDGARAKSPERWLKDAEILDKVIRVRERGDLWRGKTLTLSRLYFYSGNSYYASGKYTTAIDRYQERVKISDFAEEEFQAYYMIAKCREFMNESREVVVGAYLQAYLFRPSRYEPIYHLLRYLLQRNEVEGAKLFAERMLQAKIPPDILFVEDHCYHEGKKLAKMLLDPLPDESIDLAMKQYLNKNWIGVLETLGSLTSAKVETLTLTNRFTYYDLLYIAHSWLGHRPEAITALKNIWNMPLSIWKEQVYRLISYYDKTYQESLDELPKEVREEYLRQLKGKE